MHQPEMPAIPATTATGGTRRRLFGWELVGLLWLAYFLNQGDRQIFGVTLPLIRGEFHLSDTQMGLVATTFSIVFGLSVPVAGWLGDRFRRDVVVVASLVVFSLGTLLTGAASTFLLLLFRGIATGIGEALYAPAANTLISEHHFATRGRALSLHQTANYTGVVLGSFIAGSLADHFGWRFAFLAFGSGGLLWAIVILARIRGQAPPAKDRGKETLLLREAFIKIVATPALVAQTIGFAGLVFILVGYLTWTPSLLAERFHLSLAEAGFQSVAWHHLLAYIGLLAAGTASDHLSRAWPRVRLVSMGFSLVAFAPFLFISATASSAVTLYLALAAFGFFRGIYDASLYAAIFERIENRLRASVTGLIVAVAYVVGALSPLIMGALRQHYGLEAGMKVLSGSALVAGVVFLIIIWRADGEEARAV
jgi:MFS family permease